MEKSPVHGAEAELAKRSAVRIRQDRFTAKFAGDALESRGDFVECLVPGDSLESLGWHRLCGSDILVRAGVGEECPTQMVRTLGRDPPHWVQHAIRRIDAV